MSLAERVAQSALAMLAALTLGLGEARDAAREAIRPGLERAGIAHTDPFTPAGQAAVADYLDRMEAEARQRRDIAFGRFMVRWSEHQDLYGQPAWLAFPSGDDE